MFCPQCGTEYRPEFTRCADCDVHLVTADELRRRFPDEEPDTTPSVTVFETSDLGTLELARSLLEEAGIGCSVRNERMLGMFPAMASGPKAQQPFRTAEIQVTQRNEAEARRVLAEIQPE